MNETADGLDTLDWICRQEWSDGKIGMLGDSYLGGVQFALASQVHPAPCALAPRFVMGDSWRQAFYSNGAFSLALVFSWLCLEVAGRISTASLLPLLSVEKLLRELPLLTLDEKAGCGVVPAYRDYVSHTSRDEYWQALSWRDRMHDASTPILLVGGWYDYYPGETLRNYAALQQSENAAAHRVLIGPWTHGINPSTQLGEMDFSPSALQENDATSRWLECMLKGGTAEQFQEAPLRLFVMGRNQWRDEWEWPLRRTQYSEWYLHSQGAAQTSAGEGTLNCEKPQNEAPDQYLYDPQNPVPTRGGNHSVGPYNPGLYELCLPGPYDQSSMEEREDVLVYSTAPLTEAVEVTGPVVLKLHAASSALDTDWVARLCDVYPDGRSINITEGVLRARFHEGNWEKPSLLEPERIYEYTIELQPTSNVFGLGHRIRLQITSSNFPLWDRNLNTGEDAATGTAWCVAKQTIHHDAVGPSHLILPIIILPIIPQSHSET